MLPTRIHAFASVVGLALLACGCGPIDTRGDGEPDETEAQGSELGTQKPSNTARVLGCPIVSSSSTGGFASSASPVTFDTQVLGGVVDSGVKATVILIRHVNGEPVYRYLSNGTQNDIFQPWSSTKFFAAATGGAKIRKKSNGKVGLTGKTSTGVPLGDLVTIIASYREQNYTSNGLGRYFLNVGGRPEAASLVHDWLGRPASETYGSNYGQPAPDSLGYRFVEGSESVTISADTSTGPNNQLSTRTLAEYMKRLVMWEDQATRLPNLQQGDIETLMYGAAESKYWPSEKFGGLSADLALHVQRALDMDAIETKSKGRWRIFGKLGYGCNDDRGCERVNVQYLCFPEVDDQGAPKIDRGAEMVIATKIVTRTGDGSQAAADAAHKKILTAVLPLAQPAALEP